MKPVTVIISPALYVVVASVVTLFETLASKVNVHTPLHLLSSTTRPVTVIFTDNPGVYEESMLGVVQTIIVLVIVFILQRLFIASPTKTLVESAEAKLRPVIVISYPPPIGPEIGETF